MDVEDAPPEGFHDGRPQDPHEPREADQVDALAAKDVQERGVVGSSVGVRGGVEVDGPDAGRLGAPEGPGIAPVGQHQGDARPHRVVVQEGLEVRPGTGGEDRQTSVHRRANYHTGVTAAPCTSHPARPAEGTCESCGRAVCLECAVPFRGALRCAACAARAVGEEAEEAADDTAAEWRRWGADRIGGFIFLTGVLLSLLPWDRVGSRTGLLSGWAPRPDPWPLIAGLLLLLGSVTALRPAPPTRRSRLASMVLGALAAGTVLLSLPAPDFTVRSPVPLLVLGAAVAGTVLGAVGFRTSSRAPRP